jgi:hypothetical protein
LNSIAKLVLLSISVYIIWTFSTYILEGRVNLLQRIDPIGRIEYAVVVNILIGTILAFVMLRTSLRVRFVTSEQLGFQSLRRILTLVVIAIVIGFVLFLISNPAPGSMNATVIANILAQTLPTSIAEVVVCWAVVGTVFESLVRSKMHGSNWKNGTTLHLDWTSIRGRKVTTVSVVSLIVGGIVSIVLFGIYHFAHSPPFNQPNMVLFLMIPAILTSVFYFIGREIYSTITIHNLLALIGVSDSIDVTALTQPLYPVIIIAFISVLVLIASYVFLIRRTSMQYSQ